MKKLKIDSLEDLKQYGINHVPHYENWLMGEDTLWVTRCSKKKGKNENGETPKNYYVGESNIRFYKYMEEYKLKYGIISDKYGLVFDDEKIPPYDVHPSDINDEEKKRLGSIIAEKSKEYKRLVFYNVSPKLSIPYFQMMIHAKELRGKDSLELHYVTKIGILNQSVSLFH